MDKVHVVSEKELVSGIRAAQKKYQVAALTQKQEKVLYDVIGENDPILLTSAPTVLSPKKFFFPQQEVILEYSGDGKTVTPVVESHPMVLLGLRPCDLNGLKILDEAFADSNGDPNYLEKREKAIIIGLDCASVCDEEAFCYKVNAHQVKSGVDIMLSPQEKGFLVTLLTIKGQEFATAYLNLTPSDPALLAQFKKDKDANFAKSGDQFKNLDSLPEIYEKNKNHIVWEEEGAKCLSCGSCIMVCPTCYCFDVADELALSLQKGERIRRWDACMLSSFAEVHGGENFRGKAVARLKHRINRKFNYLMRKHGQSACVGCGRCVRACLVDISPKVITEVLTEEKG